MKEGDATLSPAKEKKSFFGRFRSRKEKDKIPRMSRAARENSVQARTEMEKAKSPELGKAKSPALERATNEDPSTRRPSSPG